MPKSYLHGKSSKLATANISRNRTRMQTKNGILCRAVPVNTNLKLNGPVAGGTELDGGPGGAYGGAGGGCADAAAPAAEGAKAADAAPADEAKSDKAK